MSGLSPQLALNDGAQIPQLGMGVMFIPPDDLPRVIAEAAKIGYRHFDTATHYGNEAGVGAGIAALDVPRDEIFVTTKLPNLSHGYDATLTAFDQSERDIGQVDMYLLHWPQPARGLYLESWRAMIRLRDEGRVRSIGVCNFPAELLEEIVGETGVAPVVNQVELHPNYQQAELRTTNARFGVLTESWSPLGRGRSLDDPVIAAIAGRLGSTPAAVILRWHLDLGLVVIPKASSPEHLAANLAALDIALTEEDHRSIAALDRTDGRFGPDPMTHQT